MHTNLQVTTIQHYRTSRFRFINPHHLIPYRMATNFQSNMANSIRLLTHPMLTTHLLMIPRFLPIIQMPIRARTIYSVQFHQCIPVLLRSHNRKYTIHLPPIHSNDHIHHPPIVAWRERITRVIPKRHYHRVQPIHLPISTDGLSSAGNLVVQMESLLHMAEKDQTQDF